MMARIYRTASELWPDLISKAGLTGKRLFHKPGAYDKGLIAELKEQLFPNIPGDFEKLLSRSSLSSEDLLRAFFATLKPFAEMKREILELLVAAGSKSSKDNLRIRFNFDPKKKPLDLLLEDFREQMETVENIIGRELRFRFEFGRLWDAVHAGVRSDSPKAGTDPDWFTPALVNWLDRYGKGQSFPELPTDLLTGHAEVDQRIRRMIQLTNSLLSGFVRYGRNHGELATAKERLGDLPDASGLTVAQLWQLESDLWPGAVASWIAAQRENVANHRLDSIASMIATVDKVVPEPEAITTERLVRILEDVVALPVWKYRHEVYAVWLGALMHRAFLESGWSVRFHLREGRLEFAFRGVHLATLTRRGSDKVLVWWTELETPHSALPSGVRIEAIKPDYRVRSLPEDQPDVDCLVVEAKQHRQSSSREFVAALTDYATACPKARVLLANYGSVSSSVIPAVPPDLQPAVAAHARVQPLNTSAVDAFVADIARTMQRASGVEPALNSHEPPTGSKQPDGTVAVHLRWKEARADLDLHIKASGEGGHVFYREPKSEYVELSEDVQSGPGEEIATIRGTGRYLIVVHEYNGPKNIGSDQAEITFAFKFGLEWKVVMRPPKGGYGVWWDVAQLDLSSLTVDAVQRLEATPLVKGLQHPVAGS